MPSEQALAGGEGVSHVEVSEGRALQMGERAVLADDKALGAEHAGGHVIRVE